MIVLRTVKEIQEYTRIAKAEGKTIGLCPTMGALHEGHLTLMRAARKSCDVVIASVFVNPTQFGPNEDYDAYPRQFEEDCRKLESVSVDAVFHPEPAEMYPEGYTTYVTVDGDITNKLCGAQRPGHFRGVATVVTKLINLAKADKAFFGQKDAQQVVVIKRFTTDLNMNVEINMVPICREENGLARSSRNVYLNAEERRQALCLSQAVAEAERLYAAGERDAAKIIAAMKEKIDAAPLARIDYLTVVDTVDLLPVEKLDGAALVAMAVYLGKTRLIDNTILGE